MILASFLIPVADNQGQMFSHEHFDDLLNRLVRDFGGCTDLDHCWGIWKSPTGHTHSERNRNFQVAISSWLYFPLFLDTIAWAQRAFGQEAIYVVVAGIPEVLDQRGQHSE